MSVSVVVSRDDRDYGAPYRILGVFAHAEDAYAYARELAEARHYPAPKLEVQRWIVCENPWPSVGASLPRAQSWITS